MSSPEVEEFEVIDQLEASLSPEELSKIQTWLHPTEYEAQSSEFNRHLASQAPGTGLWVCETSKYQQWQNSVDHGSLWIKGVPGAGKSVTAASIIDHLSNHEKAPVLSFFFRYIISANRRPRSLIRDFLAQLLPYSARLQSTLQPLVGTPLDDFSDERLWDYLVTALSSMERVYCVVDALDEMELLPNDKFLDRLNSLAVFRPGSVKVLMTSRPKQYLQSALRESSIVHISLEDDLVGRDISLFLSYRLKNLLPRDDEENLRSFLVSSISQRSGGLFLYARLLLDQIIPNLGSTDVDVKKLVKDLPIGLEEMYNNMLFHQAKSLNIDTEVQVFLLEWATHSSRALRLNELASVLASAFPTSMLPGVPKSIARSACAPLLEISEDETVQVIHHSFTEFLLNSERCNDSKLNRGPQFPVLRPEIIHKRLSVLCLNYLRSGGLKLQDSTVHSESANASIEDPGFDEVFDHSSDGYNYQEAKLRYPFLEYAIGNWGFHASKYDVEDEEFFQSVQGFLDSNSPDFKKWLEIEWIRKHSWRSSNFQPATPLHVAAFAGLTKYAKRLIEVSASIDPRDTEDRTPLHWACTRGHTQMATLLLESGAAPNVEDCRGVKPIHEAARKNYAEIVGMLLSAGVDPLTPKTRENVNRCVMCGEVSTIGETAVEYAYLQGHVDTMMELVPFLTKKDLEDLFCQCCRYGKFEAVQTIIKNTDVSPNATSSGATALYLACRAHNVDIVELLLAKGADVNQTSAWTKTNRNGCGSRVHQEKVKLPIHGAIVDWNGTNNLACQRILRLLCKAGADIEAKDADGDTPLLSIFAHYQSPEYIVVKGLLEMGADVLAVNKQGDSALYLCLSESQDIQILKLLLEYGAPVNSLDADGNTIMHTAFRQRCREPQIVSLLLEKGACCDVKNKDGVTALEDAVNSNCGLEILTMLLQSCSDASAVKKCLWELGWANNAEERIKVIRLLQKFGASLEDRNENGETVLLARVSDKETFGALIECGADITVVDSNGQGLLHHFIQSTHNPDSLSRMEAMVGKGLDPLKVDYAGNNLLHLLAKDYKGNKDHELILEKLLDYGISVNSKNNKGLTALHIHIENLNFRSRREHIMRKPFAEVFDERFNLPLLNSFQKYKQSVDINTQDDEGLTILHLAAQRSETCLYYLIEKGADPEILTKQKRNALHLACRARQSNVVGYLCQTKNKISVNQRDSRGRTPLHDACTSGRPESVDILLRAGADVTLLDENKRTALHACAEFADEERIWTLLAHRNEEAGHVLIDRSRPIIPRDLPYEPWYTSRHPPERDHTNDLQNKPNIGRSVKSLIAAGSDVVAQDSFRRTPLELAIEYDCREMVQELQFSLMGVNELRKLKEKDLRMQTIVELALRNSPLSTMDHQGSFYQEISRNPSTYLPVLTINDIEWLSTYNKDIQNVNGATSTPPGQSLYYIAASQGLTQLMEKFGSAVRINDDPKEVLARVQGISDCRATLEYFAPTLHVACARELPNMDIIQILVEKCGVDVNTRALVKSGRWAALKESVKGGTALHVLAKSKYWWQLEGIKYLHRSGAEIDSINENGETPLHIACTGTTFADMDCTDNVYGFWRIECVKLLLDLGADINILDKNGFSCLHKAGTSPQIMRILLERGADVNIGKISPIFPAIQMQCLQTVTMLIESGTSPMVIDPSSEGFSLHYNVKKKDQTRWALFCTSFAQLHNQLAKHSARIVRLLIKKGADVYAPLADNDSLIYYVMENAEYDIVSAFLDCASKIDFSSRDSIGRTVFLAACDWGGYLPGYGRRRHWDEKKIAPFLRILQSGADPLAVDNEGRNALHHLLDNPDMEEEAIIEFLAHSAAKQLIHQKDTKGFTPLNCALRLLRPAVVEVLLTMGADLLCPDPTGATALHRIAEQCLSARQPFKKTSYGSDREPSFYIGLLVLWKKYLALGGSINVQDNNGSSPLFDYLSSARRNHYKDPEEYCCHLENFATYFSEDLTKDLDVTAKNKDGENALHIIARRENAQIPSRGHVNEDNHSPKANHNKDLYQFFMRKGLNPLEEDANGRSSLDVAAACEQDGILELFQYAK